MAKNKLYWEKEKKKRERKKEKRKRKKEEKSKKENKRRKKKKERGGKGGEANRNEKKNMGEYLLILYTLSPLTSPGNYPSSWSSGRGACCADFQVLALGGAALSPAWCRAE